MDIFFIDWEHEKDILIKNATELRTEKYRGAWRVLQVANQFNELQKRRNINLPFCFFWLIFFWGYLNWGQKVSSVPGTNYTVNSPDNYILQHFLASFILLCAGLGNYFAAKFFQLWIPLKKNRIYGSLQCIKYFSIHT